MNDLLELLKGGDLRSDGHADEVAEDVIQNPDLFDLLFDGLKEDDDLVRGRTAHALEKVSRVHPELFTGHIDKLIGFARNDHLPFTLWHLAMLFPNLMPSENEKMGIISTLFYLLEDKSTFVKTWSISSLTILALKNPHQKTKITAKIKSLEDSESTAVKKRVSKALDVLEGDAPLPKGWSKV